VSACFKLRRCSDDSYAEFTKSIFVISNPVYVLQFDLRKFTAKGKGRPVTCHADVDRRNRGIAQPMLNLNARWR
jgi:hypothetical protein